MKMSADLFPQQSFQKFHFLSMKYGQLIATAFFTKPAIISKRDVQSLLRKFPYSRNHAAGCRNKNVSECMQKYRTVCDWRFVFRRWISPNNKDITFCKANSIKIQDLKQKKKKENISWLWGKSFIEKKHKMASSMVLNLNWVLISFEVYHIMHSPGMHQFFTAYPLKDNIR